MPCSVAVGYQHFVTTWCHKTEDPDLNLHCHENPESRISTVQMVTGFVRGRRAATYSSMVEQISCVRQYRHMSVVYQLGIL